MRGNALQHGWQVQRGGDLAAHLGNGSHFACPALGLVQQARLLDCYAYIGGEGGQQAQIVFIEAAFLLCALHADHAYGLPAGQDRHAQVGARFPAGQSHA